MALITTETNTNPIKKGTPVLVNGGMNSGTVVEFHTTKSGVDRVRVRWYHPSESRPQVGWFDLSSVCPL